MKKLILLSLLFIFSCSENTKKENQFQYFIDVDINGDYTSYFEKLSDEYKDALKFKYKTTEIGIVYDSIIEEKKEFHNFITNNEIILKNFIIDSIESTEENYRLIKYRVSMYDTKQNAKLFKDRILIESTYNGEKKYTPYDLKLTPKIDSIINDRISSNLIVKAHDLLKFKEYNSNNSDFEKIKNRFSKYVSYLESNDLKLLEFIYPPILETLLINSNQTEFTHKQKLELIEYIISSRNSQEMKFKRFLINQFDEIDCIAQKESYILDYAIDIENNIYIQGKAIVIKDNNNFYFIEADLEELKQNFENIFDQNTIDCLEFLLGK
ncbi:hypothetical protein [Flavobacterium sp. JP2137]|uniref:hypothetical protein n=1 Tax=Flavobacterium sp. JP2137 TaxID=3414510 RepID=UPI003D2FDD7B